MAPLQSWPRPGSPNSGEEGQEEHLQWTHFGDRGSSRSVTWQKPSSIGLKQKSNNQKVTSDFFEDLVVPIGMLR